MEAKDINTLSDAERFVEGCLNDLIEGISTKGETMKQFAKYTGRIMEMSDKHQRERQATREKQLVDALRRAKYYVPDEANILLALIESLLNNQPDETITFDEKSGTINIDHHEVFKLISKKDE